VVVVPPVVVVVVPPVVVVVAPVVVVVVEEAKEMLIDALSLASSPKVSVQVSPAACSAVVGGHGYRAASAVGLFPALSVAGQVAAAGAGPQGGPTVPSITWKTVEMAPFEVVVTRASSDGAMQLTLIVELTRPPTITVGWCGSELHSSTLPMELLAKPVPVRVTAEPLVRPVVGVPVIEPAAKADMLVPRITEPMTTRTEARTINVLARASRPPDRHAVILDRLDLITTHPRV
jgi:hypothetical protein